MESSTPKTLSQQSDLNGNGILEHPREVAHLERAVRERAATMDSVQKDEIVKNLQQADLPHRDADKLSQEPIATLGGVRVSEQALQKIVDAMREGVGLPKGVQSYGLGEKIEKASEPQQASSLLTPDTTPTPTAKQGPSGPAL